MTVRAQRTDGTAFDTVGRLTGIGPESVTVEGRNGPVTVVWGTQAVGHPLWVAGRVVPPDVCAVDLQRIAQSGWPPEETQEADGWELRWAHGVSQRCNSVRVASDPGPRLPALLESVAGWYTARAALPLLQVPRPWLADALASAAWEPTRAVVMMTAETARVAATQDGVRGPAVVSLADEPDSGWCDAARGEHRAEDVDVLRGILRRPAGVVFATATAPDGSVAGVARASASSGWCGITSVATEPSWRRRGVARQLTAALAAWAHESRLPSLYLQVLESNEPALSLYRALGFTRHHAYDYWRPRTD